MAEIPIHPAAPTCPGVVALCEGEIDGAALASRLAAGGAELAFWTGPTGACGVRLLGGQAARVWFSCQAPDESLALLRHAGQWLDGRQVKWRQMLLRDSDPRRPLAESAGYHHETNVQFWSLALEDVELARCPSLDARARIQVVEDPTCELELFAATLAESLDASTVTDRSCEDQWDALLASSTQPRLLRIDQFWPSGCLLLDAPPKQDWTVQYLGVIPAMRRGGFARQLLAEAARQLRAGGVPRLAVAVSADNAPALALYRSCGFRLVSRAELWANAGQSA